MHCHTQRRPDCDDDVEGLYDEDDGDDKDDDDGDLPTVLVCGAMFVLSARLFRGCLQFVFGSDLFFLSGKKHHLKNSINQSKAPPIIRNDPKISWISNGITNNVNLVLLNF